jgi:hypothetical protein
VSIDFTLDKSEFLAESSMLIPEAFLHCLYPRLPPVLFNYLRRKNIFEVHLKSSVFIIAILQGSTD